MCVTMQRDLRMGRNLSAATSAFIGTREGRGHPLIWAIIRDLRRVRVPSPDLARWSAVDRAAGAGHGAGLHARAAPFWIRFGRVTQRGSRGARPRSARQARPPTHLGDPERSGAPRPRLVMLREAHQEAELAVRNIRDQRDALDRSRGQRSLPVSLQRKCARPLYTGFRTPSQVTVRRQQLAVGVLGQDRRCPTGLCAAGPASKATVAR
jgi:hypothetical protein